MTSIQIMVVGLAVLAVLALVNGVVEGRAQRRAWRSIAAQRHELRLARQGAPDRAPRCGSPGCPWAVEGRGRC